MSFASDEFRHRMRMELRASMASTDPLAHYAPPVDGLPGPLREAALRMREGTPDERKAAANEFLLLSEEWVDLP